MSGATPPATIYHLARSADWDRAQRVGSYAGSQQDRVDGFLHFSTREQIVASAALHRAGEPDLLLLTVATAVLGEALRWELSRNGVSFPHLYGALALDAVIRTDPLPIDAQGRHRFPADLPSAGKPD